TSAANAGSPSYHPVDFPLGRVYTRPSVFRSRRATMPDSDFFDELETRDPAERERRLFELLPEQIANAQKCAPGFARILDRVDAVSVTSRAALARLPVTRKSELIERQKKSHPGRDPFGGLTAVPTGQLARIFASPGPIYDPEAMRPDYWR